MMGAQRHRPARIRGEKNDTGYLPAKYSAEDPVERVAAESTLPISVQSNLIKTLVDTVCALHGRQVTFEQRMEQWMATVDQELVSLGDHVADREDHRDRQVKAIRGELRGLTAVVAQFKLDQQDLARGAGDSP